MNIKEDNSLQFEPTFHKVAQSFPLWPIVVNDKGYKIKLFEWGVIADYMNTPEKIKEYRSSMANARSEKIINDPRSIWHKIRNQRCLIFTTGFFEHHDAGLKKKIPYFIKVTGQPIFCFAGLYNYSPVPDKITGEMIGTFTVITRPANAVMAKIHNGGANSNRMPLILSKEMAIRWLNETASDEEIMQVLNYEFPSSKLDPWPVNTIRTRKEDNENILDKINYNLL
ncbi:MAG: SOS response-associated peptidase family protein [Bacteroidota bacterium]|nr:SOS response-associated peptidase family protein [Bacteroidota bacterium]